MRKIFISTDFLANRKIVLVYGVYIFNTYPMTFLSIKSTCNYYFPSYVFFKQNFFGAKNRTRYPRDVTMRTSEQKVRRSKNIII